MAVTNVKQQVKAVLDDLPEDTSIEEIQYRLYVLGKLRQGIQDAEDGRTIPHRELLKRVKKWRKR